MSNAAVFEDSFDSIQTALRAVSEGIPVVVTDDEDRENEGDLVVAAARATAQSINLMMREACGLICVPMAAVDLKRLSIGQMVPDNREAHKTAFTVSVDAAEGITTGISAHDRWRTVRVLSDPNARPQDLVQPGHLFPLRAQPGGVLQRAGHTEAAIDLAVLAGLPPCGVICEIANHDGSMARLPELTQFARRRHFPLISIADLIRYRFSKDKLVERLSSASIQNRWGIFDVHVYRTFVDSRTHVAFTRGSLDASPILVRMHAENKLSDVFQFSGVGASISLSEAFETIAQVGRGVVVWLEQSQNTNAPADFVKSLAEGKKLEEATSIELRDYGIGAQILADLGLRQIKLLSSSHRKIVGLDSFGLEVVETISPS